MWAGALLAVSMGMDTWAQEWLISITAVGSEAEGLPPGVWVALVGAVGGKLRAGGVWPALVSIRWEGGSNRQAWKLPSDLFY